MAKRFLLPCVVAVAVLLSCSSGDRLAVNSVGPPPVQDLALARHDPQGFVALPFEKLPFMNANISSCRSFLEPVDSDGIEMSLFYGAACYHPVNLCHRTLGFISAYFQTRDTFFLGRAERTTRKLMQLCEFQDSAAFASYQFPFNVHGDSRNHCESPWFSGMAQGEFLEVLVRLFEVTQDSSYLDFANRVFVSLEHLHLQNSRWVAQLDSDRYYWIEEYPLENGMDQTLNGFIAAVFGVYDYYRVTGTGRAKSIYELSLTTLKRYLPEFRRPGLRSYYCLGHRVIASDGYHALHCNQLHYLAGITGDQYFEDMARLFESDVAGQ
ncbi:MAG: D-glucuronyl C5-epimerase family protein [Candidatus Zixiibacteriota bacterium]